MPLNRTDPPSREGWIDPRVARKRLKEHLDGMTDEELNRNLDEWGLLEGINKHFGREA